MASPLTSSPDQPRVHHSNVPLNKVMTVKLFGPPMEADVHLNVGLPEEVRFVSPTEDDWSELLRSTWAAVAGIENPRDRIEVHHGPYLVELRVAEMVQTTASFAVRHRTHITIDFQFLTSGPLPPRPKPPAPLPWTAERIASVKPHASLRTTNFDPALWYLVTSRYGMTSTEAFNTLGEAVEFGGHGFEQGDLYALCVVRSGSLYYWYWPTLDDPSRDACIERAIAVAKGCGLNVTKVVRRIGYR